MGGFMPETVGFYDLKKNEQYELLQARPELVGLIIPQQDPFRFVNQITFLDDSSIVGDYYWPETDSVFKGHFPGRPVVPGVLLTEMAAQIVLTGGCLYWFSKKKNLTFTKEGFIVYFTNIEDVRFKDAVEPGDLIECTGSHVKLSWKCTVDFKMFNKTKGKEVASGRISGMVDRASLMEAIKQEKAREALDA
jgi:3-hydroxyacyl-[acyl-carrier-protein] dehydratase